MGLYFITPHKGRWSLLLASSFFFYSCWKPAYLLLIITSIVVDYFAAIGIEKATEKTTKKILLGLSLLTNLGMLFVFKYFKFFLFNISQLIPQISLPPDSALMQLVLPVGISFYTFQTMGYTIDVYNNKMKAERHMGYFALYVSFFPQLVAGPIERAGHLIPQFKKKRKVDINNLINGSARILWGFFKKVVIADRLALFADVVFANPTDYSGFTLVLGILFFTFQIYCDFSGYSDVAIGIAKVMGIDLIENFKLPYNAINVKDFWNRWHISLSSWFRDYLYIPLGGSRASLIKTTFNLLVVFTLSGLWHGANWTFLLWGLIHGLYLLIYKFTKPISSKLPKLVNVTITFFAVSFAWVFFRAKTVNDAFYILGNIFSKTSWKGFLPGLTLTDLILSIIFIIFMAIIHRVLNYNLSKITEIKPWKQILFFSVTFCLVISFGIFNENKFLYFQF
ncbi:MAG: MBOAT family O-acyltransferase [Candidatus Zophobacter franzmannii]|nr:MBOAT family O-acyltransferase [Candidatus Zophobacter franzmannii]